MCHMKAFVLTNSSLYRLPPNIVRLGRHELSWCLLQYISGSVGKMPLPEFAAVLALLTEMYNEKDALPLPQKGSDGAAHARVFAAAAVFVVVHNRVEAEEVSAQLPLVQVSNALVLFAVFFARAHSKGVAGPRGVPRFAV